MNGKVEQKELIEGVVAGKVVDVFTKPCRIIDQTDMVDRVAFRVASMNGDVLCDVSQFLIRQLLDNRRGPPTSTLFLLIARSDTSICISRRAADQQGCRRQRAADGIVWRPREGRRAAGRQGHRRQRARRIALLLSSLSVQSRNSNTRWGNTLLGLSHYLVCCFLNYYGIKSLDILDVFEKEQGL